MAEFKIVINDPKTGKTYQKTLDEQAFIGKKIGDKIDGNLVGMAGFELEITGGSDVAGFPMRKDIQGSGRKRALLTSGTGVHIKRKGKKVRKTVMGSTISENIVQINLKIVKGDNVEKTLGLEAPAEEAKPEEVKEKPQETESKDQKENETQN
ncbi:MAG: 30S ribosomal protein S6e [archaeon]